MIGATLSGSRLAWIAAAAAIVVALVPATAAAAQDPDSCGASTSRTYTTPAPSSLRTAGTHHIQWQFDFVDAATGERITDDQIFNQITIDPSAPAYPNAVLLRLFRNSTILADRSVTLVETMRSTQDARLYMNVSWPKGQPFFAGPFRVSVRWETGNNLDLWSNWLEIQPGPDHSFCVETTSALWKKGYGWE